MECISFFLKVQLNGFPHMLQQFVAGLALATTSGETDGFANQVAVPAFLNDDMERAVHSMEWCHGTD